MKKQVFCLLAAFIAITTWAASDKLSGEWQGKTHVVNGIGQGEGVKVLTIQSIGHKLYRGMDSWHRVAFTCNKMTSYCNRAIELKLAGHNGVIGTQLKNGSIHLIKLGEPTENIILTPSKDGKTLDYVIVANNKSLVGHAVLHRVTKHT